MPGSGVCSDPTTPIRCPQARKRGPMEGSRAHRRWVCSRCVIDEPVVDFVQSTGVGDEECDYCETEPPARTHA